MSISAMLLAASLAGGPIDQVRNAELAFARAFADRDKTAFFAMVADDATFLSGTTTSIGKKQVIESWTRYLESAEAPFSWAPERVSVSADGTLGLSTGPVYDARGRHAGSYISTWRKDAQGNWKIVFDSSGPSPAPMPEHALKIEEGFVPTPDGVQLFYRKVGRGPVTIVVPLDFALFDHIKQFADVATVISYDLRNRGRSSKAKDVVIQDDVRDLETVRAHFKLEQFIPIGFSYLGKMVVLYAVEHPQRVSRLVQIGPLGNRRIDMPVAQDFGAPPEVIRAWQEAQKPDSTMSQKDACLALANLMAYYMAGDPKNAKRFDVAGSCAHENEYPVNVNPHFSSLMKSSGGPLTAEQLAKVSMPVLTIHGRKDRQAAYEGGVAWARELPNARLVTLEEAAHAIWLDEPALLFASIRQFLRGEWPLLATSAAPATDRASTPTDPDAAGSAPRTRE
jgi:pimeloyl-ACP methyl ester carboxylesterase/ketosteroid isomerase-like protein